jgi:hypothetical protein
VLKKYIYGGHVAEYMEEMEEEDPEKYNRWGGGRKIKGSWEGGFEQMEEVQTENHNGNGNGVW